MTSTQVLRVMQKLGKDITNLAASNSSMIDMVDEQNVDFLKGYTSAIKDVSDLFMKAVLTLNDIQDREI